MEGNDLIKLTPFFPPNPAPRGLQRRRLTRHGFLSNTWGLRRNARSLTSSMSAQKYSGTLRGGASLSSDTRGDATYMKAIESRVDHNFSVLRLEFHNVNDSVRKLAKSVDKMSEQLTEHVDKILDRPTDTAMIERLETVHAAEKANLEMKYRLEVERVAKESKADHEHIVSMESDLQFETMRAAMATEQLAEARLEMEEYAMQLQALNQGRMQEDPDKVVKDAFLGLRDSILDFARSSSLQLGPLPDVPEDVDSFCHPRIWNDASRHQRKRRVMAQIFYLLYRRILRPGLRVFGLQAFIKSGEHPISTAEAHLRSLERELEARRVDDATLVSWRATTLDTTAPLRDIPRHVEGITEEILEALSPIVKRGLTRDETRVRQQMSAICEAAVHLKLAMRRYAGNYKIEVPSRDAKKWGEPGCDNETRALGAGLWLSVIDHEDNTETGGKRGDIACIPFGALTKVKVGTRGEVKKVILEKGWVISRGPAGARKRAASETMVREESEQPMARLAPHVEVSSAKHKRLRALMSEE